MEVESSGYNRPPEAQRAEDKKSLTLDYPVYYLTRLNAESESKFSSCEK